MTTALVLAAGLGTRLRTVTDGPKWLVPVEHTSPMHEQLGAIAATDAIERVVVVVSGDTSALRARVDQTSAGKPVELVDNPDAHRWNNWSSALVGLESVEDGGVVLLNSDLFASREWLSQSLRSLVDSPSPALLVDAVRPLTDEAMKVAGTPDLSQIGKTGVGNPIGEYVGMAWWPRGAGTSLRSILRSYRDDRTAAGHWYEHGIQDDMRAGIRYAKVDTPSVDWVEIDDEHDHQLAVKLVQTERWSESG